MFLLNCIFYCDVYKIQSEFQDSDIFSLAIAFFTLLSTIVIAVLQVVNQKGERLLIKKDQEKENEILKYKEFQCEVLEFVSNIEKDVILYNFLYEPLKNIFFNSFYNELNNEPNKDLYFIIQIKLKSKLRFENYQFTICKIKFNNQVDSVIFYKNITDKFYILIYRREIVLDILKRFVINGDSEFEIEFNIEKDEKFSAVITLTLTIESLFSYNDSIETDGICKLKVWFDSQKSFFSHLITSYYQ